MNEGTPRVAIIEAAVSLVFLGVMAYVLDPARLERNAARVASLARRMDGSDVRSWLASPSAGFARSRRDAMLAEEFTVEGDCGCSDA